MKKSTGVKLHSTYLPSLFLTYIIFLKIIIFINTSKEDGMDVRFSFFGFIVSLEKL